MCRLNRATGWASGSAPPSGRSSSLPKTLRNRLLLVADSTWSKSGLPASLKLFLERRHSKGEGRASGRTVAKDEAEARAGSNKAACRLITSERNQTNTINLIDAPISSGDGFGLCSCFFPRTFCCECLFFGQHFAVCMGDNEKPVACPVLRHRWFQIFLVDLNCNHEKLLSCSRHLKCRHTLPLT